MKDIVGFSLYGISTVICIFCVLQSFRNMKAEHDHWTAVLFARHGMGEPVGEFKPLPFSVFDPLIPMIAGFAVFPVINTFISIVLLFLEINKHFSSNKH